jgi:hypothetical protein
MHIVRSDTSCVVQHLPAEPAVAAASAAAVGPLARTALDSVGPPVAEVLFVEHFAVPEPVLEVSVAERIVELSKVVPARPPRRGRALPERSTLQPAAAVLRPRRRWQPPEGFMAANPHFVHASWT